MRAVEWMENYKIPVGPAAKQVVNWLTENFGWLFDGMALAMQALIDSLLFVLGKPHPLFVIAAFVLMGWYLRRSFRAMAAK